jgi:hypothetical protein
MHKFSLKKTWPDSEVFIIGGGKSLESFDWRLLLSELTIGCNDAYLLGEEVCSIAIFGDNKWWKLHRNRLEKFKGRVFTNCNHLQRSNIPWLNITPRYQWGLVKNGLAWNGNTGSSAINLALLLGAKKVYLLGFDCKVTDKEANWHENTLDNPNPEVYPKFIDGFKKLKKALPTTFPGCEIINVSDVTELKEFPIIGMKEFWEKRNENN